MTDHHEKDAMREALAPPLDIRDRRPASSRVLVEIGARSHRGAVRTNNEDHYLVVRLGRQQETLATSLPRSDLPERFDEYGYTMLVADGLGFHIPRGYLYFAIAFSLAVELLNIRARDRTEAAAKH